METRVLTVSDPKAYYPRATAKPKRCPVVRLQGDWLNEIGFNWGKLATAEYTSGRIILQLQDSGNYKELVKGAFKANSGLFQVRRTTNNKLEFPQIDIRGFRMEQSGFILGSVVIARYEYGLIRFLLVDLDLLEESQESLSQEGLNMETRLLTVTHAKAKRVNRRRPVIKLQGAWLVKIGFTAGKLVAAEYGQGQIVMRLQDSDRKDSEKGLLKASLGLFLIQTAGKSELPLIDIKGFWLERFGFTIGGVVAARYEYGLIKLLLIDPERFQE